MQIDFEGTLKNEEEARIVAEMELTKICDSWILPAWDEVDWSRIRELRIRDLLETRARVADAIQMSYCIECPDIAKHVSMISATHADTTDSKM